MLNKFGEVLENASLKQYNSYGIETSCDYLVKVSSIENLVSLLQYIEDKKLNYFLLGGGTNVILPDEKFHGIVISLENLDKVSINDHVVTAEAGVKLGIFVKMMVDEGLEGVEYLALIPGSLGGALYGNAGVKDHTIYDNLVNVSVIRDKRIVVLNKEDITISYRHTSFKENNDIIVGATFNLSLGNKEEMKEVISESRKKRMESQPLEYKNAGSVFKNPTGTYAGKLIEEAGLKGFMVGDAEVSQKHANFIINHGNATSKDIKELIRIIQEEVYKKFNILLELEQIIVEWE